MVVSFIDGGSQSTYSEEHRPAKSHRQTLSHNVDWSTPRHEWDSKSQPSPIKINVQHVQSNLH